MERKIKVGSYYRHFKGNLYQVDGFGVDATTREDVVLYHRADLDEYKTPVTFVRPYYDFSSLVDKEKYPWAKQKYRFEEEVYDFGGETWAESRKT